MAQQDPFATGEIHSRIAVAVTRAQARILEWTSNPVVGTLDDRIVQTPVETLDAHAAAYLMGVDRQERLPEFATLLRRTGDALMKNAEGRGPLFDPYTDDRLRKSAESSSSYRHARTRTEREHQLNREIEQIRLATRDKALKWAEWQNQLIIRVGTHFEARYRHWAAEALEQVQQLPATSSAKASPEIGQTLGVTKWEDLQIWFVSEERIRIHCGQEIANCNYGDFGFADRRNGKPNREWKVLQVLAAREGTIYADAARASWTKIEKRVQEIRRSFRDTFGLSDDPIPYVEGEGYRAKFKIAIAPSYRH